MFLLLLGLGHRLRRLWVLVRFQRIPYQQILEWGDRFLARSRLLYMACNLRSRCERFLRLRLQILGLHRWEYLKEVCKDQNWRKERRWPQEGARISLHRCRVPIFLWRIHRYTGHSRDGHLGRYMIISVEDGSFQQDHRIWERDNLMGLPQLRKEISCHRQGFKGRDRVL